MSSWRVVSINTWKRPVDPSTYGLLKFEASNFFEYAKLNDISVTQLFTKVMGLSIAENPEINRMIRGSSLYQREDVDIFLQVSVDDNGHDLSGTVIRKVDKKTIKEIQSELVSAAMAIRKNEDLSFKKVKKSISLIPPFLTRIVLGLLDLILYRFNFYISLFGVKSDPFGSCMITSVGNFGVDFAFAPIPTISHVPLVMSLFKIKEEPIVKDGEIKIQKTLSVGATLDHRIIDGLYASKLIKSMEKYISSPHLLENITK